MPLVPICVSSSYDDEVDTDLLVLVDEVHQCLRSTFALLQEDVVGKLHLESRRLCLHLQPHWLAVDGEVAHFIDGHREDLVVLVVGQVFGVLQRLETPRAAVDETSEDEASGRVLLSLVLALDLSERRLR